MTEDTMDLSGLVEKTPDAELLREMIGFAYQRPMELFRPLRVALRCLSCAYAH